ncbi:hypothetical protein XF_1119 [Xylella fastidiosa 9a5c]|uniref:Uncharacterized protein n=1 Tax=Xylella fastidiosa (strain 9a5c) TaxID=160492 RepID=Q9PEA9_XYLFA|nr:hypothetical protein XF_1119 [Xylella fastidiosa 9a5c]
MTHTYDLIHTSQGIPGHPSPHSLTKNAVTTQYTHDMDTAGASHHTNQATSSIRTKATWSWIGSSSRSTHHRYVAKLTTLETGPINTKQSAHINCPCSHTYTFRECVNNVQTCSGTTGDRTDLNVRILL